MEINRKRVAKRLASGLMAGALALGGLAISGSSPAGAVPIGDEEFERLAGTDRYSTAAAVADYIDDAANLETVIVANGENFPDALAASSLAYEYDDAALLLVGSDSIPDVTENMMNRLNNTVVDVIVVGGESAVSAGVFEDIEAIFDDSDVVRVSGDNRYATAAEIADESGWNGNLILLASGESFADAVTVGGYSALTGSPILLANSSGLPDETVEALETALDEGYERVAIIGGSTAVSSDVEEALVELGFDPWGVSRIAGADRYATNLNFNLEEAANDLLAVNKYLDVDTVGDETNQIAGERMILVSGANFPDALAAAPLAYLEIAHIVLVNPTTVGASALTLAGAAATSLSHDSSTDEYVSASLWEDYVNRDHMGENVWVVGGLSAVPSSVTDTISSVATGNLGCSVLAPASNDSGDGSQVVYVVFAGNLQNGDDPAGTDDSELELLLADASLIEVNGNDDFAVVAPADFNNDGYDDAIIYAKTGDAFEVGDEIEFAGIEQDGDVWQDGDNYGLRNVGPCSTTIAEDDDAPTVEWWGVVGNEDFFVHFSEPMAGDYSSTIEGDLATATTDVDGVVCTNTDAGTYQDYSCEAQDGGADENLLAANILDLVAADYFDAAGNELDLDDYDSDVLTSNPDVELESLTVTCTAIGMGGTREAALDTAFGGTLSSTTDALVTIPDGGDYDGPGPLDTDSAIAFLAGPGAGGLAGNNWNFTIEHERGLMIPTVSVEGTEATITIDRYVHTVDDVVRVWNNSAWGRGGLSPVWIAVASFGTPGLFADLNVFGEAYSSEDHDSVISTVLGLGGKDYGIANRSCSFSAQLSAPLLSGVTAVATNPATEGQFRIAFGSAAQTLQLQFAEATDAGWVVEGVIEDTEDVLDSPRATVYASGVRSSIDG